MSESLLMFPFDKAQRLEPHLPPLSTSPTNHEASGEPSPLPFVTLTFATSLDSALSLGPGIRTALSGPGSKAMTHYLRSRHDAICVGVGTAIADDPGLNCRLSAASQQHPGASPIIDDFCSPYDTPITARQPRPVVIDPTLRWDFTATSKVMQLARAGQGLAPYIITAVPEPPAAKQALLAELGGKFISLSGLSGEPSAATGGRQRFDWRAILAAVREEGLRSIMIEGGGEVINSLLSGDNSELLDSVIVTLAPTWLGQGSVFVSPPRKPGPDGQLSAVARLANPTWMPLGEDVVLCGKIAR